MGGEVHGRVEKRRGRCCQTSPGEETGNETGEAVIAHGSVEFSEAIPIHWPSRRVEGIFVRTRDGPRPA